MKFWLTTILALGFALPAAASDRYEALSIAQRLTNKSDGLTIQSSNDALDAFYVNTAQSRDLREIAKEARQLAFDFHVKVLDKLYTSATDAQIVREIDRITPACQRLGRLIDQADTSSTVNNLFADIVEIAGDLRSHLDEPALWYGSCRVVREFIWGDNVQEYVGTASGNTQAIARNNARQNALSACQADLANLQECNVIENDCYASQ